MTPYAKTDLGGCRRILISAQMGIGNLIMFLPFLRAVRSGFPNAHIAVVFSEQNGADEVLTTLATGLVNEVIQLNLVGRGGLSRLWRGAWLGLRGWDLAIFRFNGFKREVLAAAAVGRARWRVGHVTSPDWRNRWSCFLNMPVVMEPGDHEVRRYLQLAETLGLPIREREPVIDVAPAAMESLRSKYPALFLESSKPWVVLAPGSSQAQEWKRWPEELWASLTVTLAQVGVTPVLSGSRNECQLVERILDRAEVGNAAINTAGLLSLAECAALVHEAPTVICCDSAVMHLAAAVGTHVIALFGPTDDKRTGPMGTGHVILRSAECKGGCYSLLDQSGDFSCDVNRCMRGVSVDRVMSAVLERITLRRVDS